MNREPMIRISARSLRAWTCAAAMVFVASCSSGQSAPANEPVVGAAQSTSAEVAEPAVPLFDSYRLSYSSTCGDGPFFTDGTEIEVLDGVVTVISGEEPFSVGSLAEWQAIVWAAANDGRGVDIELSADGYLESLSLEGRGIDDEFCVTVSAFEDLS